MTAFLATALGLIAPSLQDLPFDPTALVFRLTVGPAPVPAPRLKYELLPRPQDRTPGNAVIDYLRAGMLLPKMPRLESEAWQARENMLNYWRQSPPGALPLASVKRESQPFAKAMTAADRAARAGRCDWQPPRKMTFGSGGIAEDAQPLREVVSWLRYRVKVELAEGRTDDAVRTLQTMFQMAKHVGEGPTMLQMLIGEAFAAIAADVVAAWATHPGTPNLYWALATLPDPLIDPRAMLTGETELMANTFPAFAEFEKGPVSEAKARELVAKPQEMLTDMIGWMGTFDRMAGSEPPVMRIPAWVPWELYIAWKAPAARLWLRDHGHPDTARMGGTQAVYLAAWRMYRDASDQVTTAILLPLPRGAAELRRVTANVRKLLANHPDDRILRMMLLTVTATEKVYWSHVRHHRQFAALQAVEALRAHLATGKGFPAGWTEVTTVPVPDDPLTGKPFTYTLKDGTATIAAQPPAGEQPTRSNNFRYELRLRTVK